MARKNGLSRLFEIAGEKQSLLFLSGLLAAISALLMLVPYLSVYVILAELLSKGVDPSAADGDLMVRWGLIAFSGLLIGMVFLYASGMASHIAAFRILYGIRVNLAQHIGKLHLGYLTKTSVGAVKKTVEQNVEKIEQFIAHQIPDLVNVAVTVVVMFLAMFRLEGWMALAGMISILAGFALQASMMMGGRAKESVKAYYDSLERINASAIQYVQGMPAVKIFGHTVHSFRRFHGDLIRYQDLVTNWTDQFQNGFVLFKTILASLLGFVLPVGVLLLSGDPQNVSLAIVVLFFVIMVPGTATPIYKLMYLSSMISDISEGVDRIDATFSQAPMHEPEKSRYPQRHNVAFDHVDFSYDTSEEGARKMALSDVSFVAEQGQITALVGPSGSGKSTTANLIPRFWDVTEGSILIGGVDVREMRSEDLMNQVSFVFQDNFLFHDTVYNNLLVGKPEATREEVIAAAKAAQCHTLIEALAKGYETLISEGGVYLSGGETQRLTVARAMLKNAPILVLDEATAFADPENEHNMQQALSELIRDKTVILIAHRLSTIRNADKIIVLDQGRIRETGTHDSLLERNGLYRRMWEIYTDTSSWSLAGSEVSQ